MMKRLLAALLLLWAPPLSAQTITPQGRLTLTTGVPVMIADATAQSTVYYSCYAGNVVPVGATPTNLTIGSCQVSMGLDAGVPRVASGSIYDVFGVNSGGNLALCVGPAWTSATARGTGAGTTQIDQTNGGLWTNTVSLANCWGGASGTTDLGAVAAGAGTYLGSLYATANGQTGMQFAPAAAAGGSNAFVALYNAYNRVPIRTLSRDSTATWTYNSTTWRAANNSASNRITYLDGLAQSWVSGAYVCNAQFTNNVWPECGLNFDSTSATPGGVIGDIASNGASVFNMQMTGGNSAIALGLHYIQAMEKTRAGNTTFFSNQTTYWTGLTLGMMN